MPKKILIIKTGAFGDIILSSATFQTVRKNFPADDIFLLTQETFREMVEDCPVFKKVFYLPAGRNFYRLLSLMKEIRYLKFDIVLDIQGNLKTNFYAFLTGGRKRTGLYGRWAGRIFLHRAVRKRKDINPVSHQEYFLKSLNITGTENLKIWLSDTKRRSAENILASNNLTDKKYIVIHPSASAEWRTKRWLPERFAQLADRLTEKGYTAVFIGTGEKEVADILRNMKNKSLNLSGKTDFPELTVLIENAGCLVTTDSAPVHIGAAVGTKTIALFGSTDPKRHCPPGVEYIFKGVSCSPCYKKRCSTMECMKAITVEDVLSEIER
jgi:lipopolysaccharide heptosyltransferase II